MRFSYFMPNMMEGRFAKLGTITPESMLERARAVEALGYDGIWLGEFIETSKDVATGFPGKPPNLYAPLTLMGALAMVTKRLRITSGLIVLPYHDPLVLGREMATLDHLSAGRVTLGIGLGGDIEEYRRTRQQLGRVNRSEMMEECIASMRVLWNEPRASFHGKYFAFDDIEIYPKPIQNPLPIYIAGRVDAVLRRIARHGQGWIEVTFDPENMRAGVERLGRYMEEEGRGKERLEIARQIFMSIGETEAQALANRSEAIQYMAPSVPRKTVSLTFAGTRYERFVVGSVEYVRSRMHAYAEAGVTEICLTFFEPDTRAALHQLELFAEKIMPDFSVKG